MKNDCSDDATYCWLNITHTKELVKREFFIYMASDLNDTTAMSIDSYYKLEFGS